MIFCCDVYWNEFVLWQLSLSSDLRMVKVLFLILCSPWANFLNNEEQTSFGDDSENSWSLFSQLCLLRSCPFCSDTDGYSAIDLSLLVDPEIVHFVETILSLPCKDHQLRAINNVDQYRLKLTFS